MLGVLFNSSGNYFGTKIATYSESYYLGKHKSTGIGFSTQLFWIKSLKFFQTEIGWMEYLRHDWIIKWTYWMSTQIHVLENGNSDSDVDS